MHSSKLQSISKYLANVSDYNLCRLSSLQQKLSLTNAPKCGGCTSEKTLSRNVSTWNTWRADVGIFSLENLLAPRCLERSFTFLVLGLREKLMVTNIDFLGHKNNLNLCSLKCSIYGSTFLIRKWPVLSCCNTRGNVVSWRQYSG